MAKKKGGGLIRLVSTGGTGYFYVTKVGGKKTEKLELRKFDPRLRKHVMFKEAKIK